MLSINNARFYLIIHNINSFVMFTFLFEIDVFIIFTFLNSLKINLLRLRFSTILHHLFGYIAQKHSHRRISFAQAPKLNYELRVTSAPITSVVRNSWGPIAEGFMKLKVDRKALPLGTICLRRNLTHIRFDS